MSKIENYIFLMVWENCILDTLKTFIYITDTPVLYSLFKNQKFRFQNLITVRGILDQNIPT